MKLLSSKIGGGSKIGVVDFFCGCGGVSAGLQAVNDGATFEIIRGIDNDRYCVKTFERMIGAQCDQIDIFEMSENRELLDREIAGWDLGRFEKVLLVGCAPCQGFAAHRKSIEGHDARRNLFEAFCRIAAVIQPDAILMENVPDLFSKNHWPHFERGRVRLERAGYHVRSGIYNFAGFGLPQERFRAVVMAFRDTFEMPDAPLTSERYITVRQAIGHLPPLASGQSDPIDPMHVASTHREATLNTIRNVPKDGGNRPIGVGPKCLDRTRAAHGGYTDVYGRLAWSRPSVTITARCRTPSCGRFTHPEQDRGLTTREAALLQGFPPDYVFEGPFDDGFKQVGNAVSPLVARHLGEFISSRLNGVEHIVRDGAPPIPVASAIGPGFAVTINRIKKQREKLREAA